MTDRAIRDPQAQRVVEEALAQTRPDGPWPGVPDAEALVRRFYRLATLADIENRSASDIVGAVKSLLRLAERRLTMTAQVRVLNPRGGDDCWCCEHTVVQVVAHDMPFLVDSIAAALNDSGHGIYSIVHPRVVVRRDAEGRLEELLDVDTSSDTLVVGAVDEAWIQFEIDRETDSGELASLQERVIQVLIDVRTVVEDWQKMRVHTLAVAEEMTSAPPLSVDYGECAEASAFLTWLCDDHFTFLGYRDYDLVTDDDGGFSLVSRPASGLGLLRAEYPTSTSFARLTPAVREKAREPKALVITKANRRSTVHRPVYLDYVGVKRFGQRGEVIGERRIIGLFSTTAFAASVMTIPILRQTAERVLEMSGFPPGAHSAKDLMQFIETYPREELFQVKPEQLWPVASRVLALEERRQTELFLRPDEYRRFASALLYLPRDKYDTPMREKLGAILLRAYGGDHLDFGALLSDSVLARLHFVVRMAPGVQLPDVDESALVLEIREATRTWMDRLRRLAWQELGEEAAHDLLQGFRDALPDSYRGQVDPATAVIDLQCLAGLVDGGDCYHELRAEPDGFTHRFAMYRLGDPVMLSELLPVFASLGVEMLSEHPFFMGERNGLDMWIYHFELRLPALEPTRSLRATHLEERFSEAFGAAWNGVCEVDSLNELVLVAGLSWREVSWIRAWVQYGRQLGSQYSPGYVGQALVDNPEIARGLADLFRARLDPDASAFDRERTTASVDEGLLAEIDSVESLSYDRILRGLRSIVLGTVRTNAFTMRHGDTHRALAMKLDVAAIPAAPRPIPKFEVWVCSPRFNAVHLRFGRIARGGLRWSDRSEDFRTEVLGLAKAQTIKNAVIVPVGAKGGFVVKDPVPATDRDAVMRQGVACYREFVSALLDVTDNRVRGQIAHPDRTARWDDDDPYLVVAADKGTASFSDIANEVAAKHSFWLGDAFASGGSVGYDHKAMGITARGAWESVKRHFHEMGVDVQTDPVTVIGIGDMSGDVFGNAMLLSKSLRLIAAFDHRHIFIDPNPDPEVSFDERARLAALPRSSWADFDANLISEGGGVYSRQAKSIDLSAVARDILGIDEIGPMTPDEVVRRILLAPAEMLFNGGIGTYVKARDETNLDVADKANDAVRVNGDELRVEVVGEGGNLGLTQRGRIEAALHGVALNTDSIDNSAGVDCSDHEVNIKIALDAAVNDDRMDREERNALLEAMTDEVAELVLRDNYLQNVALGNARVQAVTLFAVHQRLIDQLEARGHLDREQMSLPDEAEGARRLEAGRGLTSPELSVLMSIAKIVLTEDLLESGMGADDYFEKTLRDYFPPVLVDRLDDRIRSHPLASSIVATQTANELVNFAGTSFVFRACEETGADPIQVARAYTVVREVFRLPDLWRQIADLDGQVPTAVQTELQLVIRRLIDRATRWLLALRGGTLDVTNEIERLIGDVDLLSPMVPDMLSGADRRQLQDRAQTLTTDGAPQDLAYHVAAALDHFSLLDVSEIARRHEAEPGFVADLYFQLSARFDIGDLLEHISQLPRGDKWSNLARASMRSDLYSVLASLAVKVMRISDSDDATARIEEWAKQSAEGQQRVAATLEKIEQDGRYDLATLSVALRMLRTLVVQGAGVGAER